MHEVQPESDQPVITALFAHYCGPWEYDRVRQLFYDLGYEFHTPDLPTDRPGITLDELAKAYRFFQSNLGAPEIVELGHSFSGDLLYRQLDELPVTLQLYMGTPLRPIVKNHGFKVEKIGQGAMYGSYVSAETRQLTDFERDREWLGYSLFSDLDSPTRDWSTSNLRTQPHAPDVNDSEEIVQAEQTDGEDSSEALPIAHELQLPDGIEKIFVDFWRDKVWNNHYQVQTARRLGLPRVSMDTGHFPMLEQPEYFVRTIINIVERSKEKRREILLGRQALVLSQDS